MKELSNTLDKPDSMRLLFRDPRNRRRIKGRARTGPPAELCVCSVCEGKNGGRERERPPPPPPPPPPHWWRQLNRGRNRMPLSSLLSFSAQVAVSTTTNSEILLTLYPLRYKTNHKRSRNLSAVHIFALLFPGCNRHHPMNNPGCSSGDAVTSY